jgi:dihydrofolate reductase
VAVRVDLIISLDGFATTTDQTPENPFGEDWSRLVSTYIATRTFRERVFKDTTGAGTTGVDDEYAKDYFSNVGAEIMGAGMFGLQNFPDDPNWRGWWGEEPPFRVPVFVLTHNPRPSIEMSGGTTFHFLNTTIADALQQAVSAANRKDVRVGGGPTVVRTISKLGLSTAFMSPSRRCCSGAASACGTICAVWKLATQSRRKRHRVAPST